MKTSIDNSYFLGYVQKQENKLAPFLCFREYYILFFVIVKKKHTFRCVLIP